MANSKKGVSLIVVLLFMLVATIAATATFRWISRQSDASASRMRTNEAYQSAVAGIDAARSWMTYHANDVGALVKQYEDGGRKPIKLNSRIAQFSRGGQMYDVYLVGANTDSSPYKLKLISSGTARNGSVYNVEAVLNVQGLYRVQLPSLGSEVNFEYAYFGGSTANHGNMNPTAMLVNGNWSGNPNSVENNFVVTGNASLSGNNLSIGKTTCIGGNLSTQNGFTGKDLYVVGNATSFNAAISGDAYFAGDVEMGAVATPGFNITGSVTLGGKMTTQQGGFQAQIGGNFCANADAQLYSNGTNNSFEVKGNVWIDNPYGIYTGWNNSDSYDKIVFGGENSAVYIRSAHPYSDYKGLMNKSFTEYSHYVKNCATSGETYEEGGSTHRKCNSLGNWGSWTYTGWGYWGRWTNGSYQPYLSANSGDGKYYLYNLPSDTTDVEFKSYQNDYWASCKAYGYDYKCSSWSYPTTIYSYYVGNKLYYDLGSTWNSFRADLSGSNITGSPYCFKGTEYHPMCGVSPWFKVGGTLYPMTSSVNFCTADSIQTRCDSLWEKKPGCDGSSYKVDDMLQTAENTFSPYASKGCAASITQWDNNLSKNLNACYKELAEDPEKAKENLYNGYLVVKVKYIGKQDPREPLDGKFVIIVEDAMGQNSLPPTTEDSYVFLLLKQGTNGEIQDAVGGGTYNYFIYTEDNASKLLFKSTLSGSVYATAENCAKISDLDISKIEYNQSLMNSLSQSKIICDAGAAACGGVSGSSGFTSSDYTISTGNMDTYYVAMAPQLFISLESQYANRGKLSVSSAEDLESSFIVLPRVVYLPKDPYGKLSDYYKVVSLNASDKFEETGITCENISGGTSSLPTAGLMYDRKAASPEALEKGIYGCKVSAASNTSSGTVPFYVVVSGEESDSPEVQFADAQLQLKEGNATSVHLTVPTTTAAARTCKVSIIRPAETTGWTVTETGGISCSGENCSIEISTSTAQTEIFRVENNSAKTSGLLFQISEVEGCNIGQKNFEYIYNAASVTVKREGLSEFCSLHPTLDKCRPGGEYRKWDGRPNCTTTSEWVVPNCGDRVTGVKNDEWRCAADGSDIAFTTPSTPNGCIVVIPSVSEGNVLKAASLDPESGDEYKLYGELKAEAQTFQVGFAGDGIDRSQTISISVTGNTERNLSCSYGDYKDNPDNCAFEVYTGETVTLSLKTDSDKDNFNYWECASGLDCTDEPFTGETYVISVTDGDVVYAHFGESDKHCFFDEFKDHGIDCSSGESDLTYCIDDCSVENCGVGGGKTSFAKWLIVNGDRSQIEYLNDGTIQLSAAAGRDVSESSKPSVMVLGTVTAGLYGTLKAQFQVPMLGYGADESAASVQKSGFILRSNYNASEYLLLSVYGNTSRELVARLCTSSGSCKESSFGVSVGSSQIVLLSATLGKASSGKDALELEVSTDSWNSSVAKVVFELSNANLSGVEKLGVRGSNEYVGFSLAAPNFKIHGIGWKSDDYASTCWDTYPTVTCSFRAAYAGGIVPQNEESKPWVGLSAWFDSKGCYAKYYYRGADACGGSTGSYSECSSGYTFTMDGPHGVSTPMTLAKAGVSGCSLGGEDASWMQTAEDDCGSFWVGEFTACSANVLFSQGSSDGSGTYFPVANVASAATVNLRDAALVVELSNENHSEVQITLYSENPSSGYFWAEKVYSLPLTTTQTGMVTFDLENVIDVPGFDVEHVAGAYVKNLGESSVLVNSVMSSCPNVLKFLGCDAKYVSTSNGWEINVTVTNPSQAKAFTVKETNVLNGEVSCDEDDADATKHCSWTSNTVGFSWADNPYGDASSKTYAFSVSATDKSGNTVEGSPYSCNVEQPSAISATCNSVSKSSVVAGEGLPVFSFSLLNCPEGKGCDYRVLLDGTEIKSGQAQPSGPITTLTTAANSAESPLAVGTHTFKLESSNVDKAFTGCSLDFDVAEKESSSSAESSSSEALSSSSSAAEVVSSSSEYAGGSSSSYSGTSMICTVEDESGNDITGQSVLAGTKFNLIWNCPGYSWGANYSKNGSYVGSIICSGSACGVSGISESTAGTYEYTLNQWNCGLSTCSHSITVVDPPPAITCPADKEKSLGVVVSVEPTSLVGCSGGCSYAISGTDATGTGYTGGAISFTGESSAQTKTYTLTVTNSQGAASCDFKVTYSESQYENAFLNTEYSGEKKIQYETTAGTCQISASSNEWASWVETGTISSNWGTVGGQISISSPLKVEIPEGETFTITNCW